MASLNGFASSVTGTTGSVNFLEAKSNWRMFICPRGIHVSANGSASPIVADSADAASRISANQWFQVGTDVSKIRQCSAVGGNSFAYSGSALSVTAGDRIVIIGSTQPTVSGVSATYQPNTTTYDRDDDAATPITNSMFTSDSNGGFRFWAADNQYDAIVQDNNQVCQQVLEDIAILRTSGDLVPSTPYTTLLGNTNFPWGSFYYAGELISGITGAAGRTYHSLDTVSGWTQGNLFDIAINNVTKVYGDTHGGIFHSWSLPQVFNVKSAKYGAKGDNSTDDTTAIATALTDAAASVSGASGGIVFLPRGTYIVNSTLTVPTKVRLVGEGRSATVIKAGGSFTFNGTTDAVVRIGTASENAHGTWLEDIQIDCNDIANSIAVYSTRINEPSGLRNFVATRFRLYGFYFTGTSTGNFTVRDCEFYCSDSATSTMKGGWCEDSIGSYLIDRCTFNSYSAAVSVGVGLHIDHTNGHLATVSNCHFEIGAIGLRQTANGLYTSSLTGHANCPVLFARDSGVVDTVAVNVFASGSPTGFSDTLMGFTAGSMSFFSESNGGVCVVAMNNVTGLTWTIPHPMTLSGRIKNSGTFVGRDFSLLGCSTTLLLPAGNGFALSTPAGNTTVTSITPLDNGRRVTFIGSSGTVTFQNGTGLKTGGPAVAPGESVIFECWGTTWHQITAKL